MENFPGSCADGWNGWVGDGGNNVTILSRESKLWQWTSCSGNRLKHVVTARGSRGMQKGGFSRKERYTISGPSVLHRPPRLMVTVVNSQLWNNQLVFLPPSLSLSLIRVGKQLTLFATFARSLSARYLCAAVNIVVQCTHDTIARFPLLFMPRSNLPLDVV